MGRCFQVLKLEVKRQPGLLGSSVFGYDDVFRTYKPFLQQWRAAEREGVDLTPCILTADVSRAFDAIDVTRLLPMAMPLLRQPEYLMVKYAEVICNNVLPFVCSLWHCVDMSACQEKFD